MLVGASRPAGPARIRSALRTPPVERREPAAFLERPDGYVAWANDDVPMEHEPAALPVY